MAANMGPVEPAYARLGRDVRRLRKLQKLTQAELAQRLDRDGQRLGRTSIANIESGKQRVMLHVFLELAEALGVDPADLLPREPQLSPRVAEQVRDLPEREQEWLMNVLSPPPTKRRRRKRDGASA